MALPTHPQYPEYDEPLKKRVDALKDEEIAEALMATQGLQYRAALKLGCSPSRLSERITMSPYLQGVRMDARQLRIDAAENGLFEAVDMKDLTAILFTLKTIGKDRGYGQDTVTLTADDPIKALMNSIKNTSKDLINDPKQ